MPQMIIVIYYMNERAKPCIKLTLEEMKYSFLIFPIRIFQSIRLIEKQKSMAIVCISRKHYSK